MSWHRGGQRMRRCQWPLLGLLLVAMFLGHDAVMAAESVAVPLHVAGTMQHGFDPHTLEDEPPALQSHAPESGHAETCRVGQSALLRSADEFDRGGHVLVVVDRVIDVIGPAGVGAGTVLWEEPHWPPGILRALLQVYRI